MLLPCVASCIASIHRCPPRPAALAVLLSATARVHAYWRNLVKLQLLLGRGLSTRPNLLQK
jgi:hypothetical protein